MPLYDVTYPKSRDADFDVPWVYLERIAGNKGNEGARARSKDGPAETLVLFCGKWVREDACGTCDGTGVNDDDPDHTFPCGACHGTGWYPPR